MNTLAPERTQSALMTREQLFGELDRARPQITAYLPPGTDPERFFALTRQAVAEQPKLLECGAGSVLRAIAQAAASGLPLDGRSSSLIVRRSKQGRPTASWSPSAHGMVAMALASGHVADVHSGVVREGDHFEFELGSEPKLVHRPSLLPKHGAVLASYAVATLRAGGRVIEVCTKADLDKIRAMSEARSDRAPWATWFEEMARKSAVRRLLKRLPASPFRDLALVTTPAAIPRPTAALALPAQAQRAALLPEEENAMECSALEQLRAAASKSELEAAWVAICATYDGRGAAVPLKVEALYRDVSDAFERREAEE